MATKDEDLQAYAKKQGLNSFGIGRELRELPTILHDDEHVEQMARAQREGKNGLLVLTSERVIWFHASVTRRDMHEHTYAKISSVEASKGMVFSKLNINAGGDNWALKDVQPKSSLDNLASLIRSHINAADTRARPGQPTPPVVDAADQIRKLAELRDQGILTEAEFAAKKAQLLGL